MKKISVNLFLKLLMLTVVLACSGQLQAQLKLPALFSDHMVLQQKDSVLVWGWTDKNQEVSIQSSWDNKTTNILANVDGS